MAEPARAFRPGATGGEIDAGMAPTKGPWRWLNDETLVGDHGRRPVVLCYGRNGLVTRGADGRLRPLTPADPDARLIEAAPDLLAALEDVCANVKDDSPDMWARVHAAIEKARGRTHG